MSILPTLRAWRPHRAEHGLELQGLEDSHQGLAVGGGRLQVRPGFSERQGGGPLHTGRSPGNIMSFSFVCFSLSGGFTPSRHLRPSSGREHTIVYKSVR